VPRIVYTVEDVKGCHFRVEADYEDATGKLTKVYDARCPYCGSTIFKRWWRHELPEEPKEAGNARP
jgi:DNA-directed RNA polymerase subunit RPC12/RpoP